MISFDRRGKSCPEMLLAPKLQPLQAREPRIGCLGLSNIGEFQLPFLLVKNTDFSSGEGQVTVSSDCERFSHLRNLITFFYFDNKVQKGLSALF